MKKIMRKSVCLVIVTALILLTFNLSVSSEASKEKIALKEPILTNVERVKIDTNEQLETALGKYSKDISEISNAKAEAMLRKFDIPFEDIKTAEVVRDNSLDRTVNRLKSDKAQIDFDENGNVVNLINYEDFSTVDKDRRDYATNQSKSEPDPVIKYETKEDLSEILKIIIQSNSLETYELVRCEFDGYGTWMLKWNKVLENNLMNSYDTFIAHLDAADGSISYLTRNTEIPNTLSPRLDAAQALVFAKPIIDQLTKSTNITTNLTFFRPNFFWEDNDFYESADFIRLAWEISLENGDYLIYIDAETGEILGGDQRKSAARALGPDPTKDRNALSVSLAAEGLTKLGYEQPNAPVNYYISQNDINWVLNSAPYYALYLSCHGDPDTTFISDNKNWEFYAYNLNSNSHWYFVFLDACSSGKKDTWYKAFGCNKSAGTGFLGWKIDVYQYPAHVFCTKFWPLVGTMTINNAAKKAQSDAEEYLRLIGDREPHCPIAFHGDPSYWGWDWN